MDAPIPDDSLQFPGLHFSLAVANDEIILAVGVDPEGNLRMRTQLFPILLKVVGEPFGPARSGNPGHRHIGKAWAATPGYHRVPVIEAGWPQASPASASWVAFAIVRS